MRSMLIMMSVFLLLGCNSDDEPVNEPDVPLTGQKALDVNQTKWADANLTTYTFVVASSCFCVPEENIVVNVVDDAVASAFFSPSGVLLDDVRLAETLTIDGYFGLIQQGIDGEFAQVDVEYNADFGFPTRLYIDRSEGIADDEVEYQIGSLQ